MTRTGNAQLLLLAILFPPAEALSQEAVSGRLQVVVEPEARMTIEAVEVPAPDSSQDRWLRVDLTVRMNPETTTTLFAEAANSTGEEVSFLVKGDAEGSPQTIRQGAPLLATTENGRHSLLVGIVTEDPEASTRFILRSSDGAIHISRIAPP